VLIAQVASEFMPPPMNESMPPFPEEMDMNLPLNSWIEEAGRFEGDIALTEEQERQLNGSERNAIINTNQKWPNNKVPYTFRGDHSSSEIATIQTAFDDYKAKTCVEFVARTNENNYIEIIKDGGCWSYVGMIGGKQQVSLANGCVYKYIAIHEFMHAIGFYHEQSRYDRDSYVRVNLGNVRSGFSNNFNKYTSSQVQLLSDYDLKSVMHYGEYDFSSNGQKTIEALDGTSPLGNEVGFTDKDLQKINALYQCSTTTTTVDPTATTVSTEATTTTTTDPDCQDNYSSCSRWADRGYCTRRRYRRWMARNCAASCDTCDACFDNYRRCRFWARRRNYCTQGAYINWMLENCPASCDQC